MLAFNDNFRENSLSELTSPKCNFDYSGPLRPKDLNCHLEIFDFATPLKLPNLTNNSHTLGGLKWENGHPPVPIYILFKDRISVLIESIRSIHRNIKTPFQLVIFNDNSTFPAAVNFLKRIEESGVIVYNNEKSWDGFVQLYELVADYIEEQNKSSESKVFIFTDPDCALDSSPPDLLWIYEKVLFINNLTIVGASLRWDDTSPYVKQQNFEVDLIRLPAEAVNLDGRNYYYINGQVDTTFGMYKSGVRMKRLLGKHIRMLPPLGIRHLDFYLKDDFLPEDYKYYHQIARKTGVNHMHHLNAGKSN